MRHWFVFVLLNFRRRGEGVPYHLLLCRVFCLFGTRPERYNRDETKTEVHGIEVVREREELERKKTRVGGGVVVFSSAFFSLCFCVPLIYKGEKFEERRRDCSGNRSAPLTLSEPSGKPGGSEMIHDG